ncbi:MAG: hypothetical protein QUS09_02285 [Methanotrichaceae archaeon]|nr:hypothetical protein [Methanotrichaceae archaeon]
MIAKIARAIHQKEVTELKLLLGGFLLCLLIAMPATAESMDLTCRSADMAGYANVSFCLPAGVSVSQEDLSEANYTGGREVRALLLFDTSEVHLHLLYPCSISGVMQDSDVKSQIEAFDPDIEAASYSDLPLSVNGQPAIWGQSGNWTFVAYQVADNALALIYFEEGLPEEILSSFLEALEIRVNEAVSPLWSGYCAGISPEQKAEPAVVYKNASSYSNSDIDYELHNSQGSNAEARMARFEATKERMMSEMEETKKRLEETKERLGGYGIIPNPQYSKTVRAER